MSAQVYIKKKNKNSVPTPVIAQHIETQRNRKTERNRMEDLSSNCEPKEGWVAMLMSAKVKFISTRNKKDFTTKDFIIIKGFVTIKASIHQKDNNSKFVCS